MRYPICGKELSSIDRQHHIKTKHHEYFYESRKWVGASYLAISNFIFFILFFSFKAENSTLAASIILVLVVVDVVITTYIVRKLKGLVGKYAEVSG